MKRTWMKVSKPGGVPFFLVIDGDYIVYGYFEDADPMDLAILPTRRADDCLSQLAQRGAIIEGPFYEPQ